MFSSGSRSVDERPLTLHLHHHSFSPPHTRWTLTRFCVCAAAGWTASSDPARAEEIFCNAVAAEAAQKRRHSSVAASAAVSAASASPAKPKGRSLGLMLDATRVARVVRGSPAHQAGLKPDDVIVKVNGIRVVKDDVGKILRMQVSYARGRGTVVWV